MSETPMSSLFHYHLLFSLCLGNGNGGSAGLGLAPVNPSNHISPESLHLFQAPATRHPQIPRTNFPSSSLLLTLFLFSPRPLSSNTI